MEIVGKEYASKYKVITLCGSTKFKNEFQQEMKRLTLEGNIILSCGLFNHADNEGISDDVKHMLDDMHLRKIDMSDGIFVINKDGYIGESTRREINYAKSLNKEVTYLENVVDT